MCQSFKVEKGLSRLWSMAGMEQGLMSSDRLEDREMGPPLLLPVLYCCERNTLRQQGVNVKCMKIKGGDGRERGRRGKERKREIKYAYTRNGKEGREEAVAQAADSL